MFPTFEIFGRQFGTYGLMAVIGFAVCFLVGSRLIKRSGIDIYDFALVMISAGVGLIIFASLMFGMTHLELLVKAFSHIDKIGLNGLWEIIKYCFGGFVYYGGFIGGAIAILIYTRFYKPLRPKRDDLLDIYGVIAPLFHGFGRIGCFLAGCCYGVESEFGFTVHGNHLNPAINDVNRFPVQLVESACNFILFFVLLLLFKKLILEKRLLYVYMLTYPVIRFILEFFRGDTIRGIYFGLSTSQWVSIALFVFALIMLPIKTKKLKEEKGNIAL